MKVATITPDFYDIYAGPKWCTPDKPGRVLIDSADSRFKVLGVFNSPLARLRCSEQGKPPVQYVSILRVAVGVCDRGEGSPYINLPEFSVSDDERRLGQLIVERRARSDFADINGHDVRDRSDVVRPQHVSYGLVAISEDGRHFSRRTPDISIVPAYTHEHHGMEDFRITTRQNRFPGTPYPDLHILTYVCPSPTHDVVTGMMVTRDFRDFQRVDANRPVDWENGHAYTPSGPFTPLLIPGKDVAPYAEPVCHPFKTDWYGVPEQVEAFEFRPPGMQHAAPSMRVKYTGSGIMDQEPISVEPGPGEYVGTGSAPVLINDGSRPMWLEVYHSVEKRYTAEGQNAFVYRPAVRLSDRHSPHQSIAISAPFDIEGTNDWGQPEFPWKEHAFIPNVVYPIGCVVDDDTARLTVGVHDVWSAVAEFPLEKLVRHAYDTNRI